MSLIIPRISWSALKRISRLAGWGALIAGAYGIVHDQITFTLSSEYFTEFKFFQFRWADFGLPDRVFVGIIGFLATWWVGMIVGWALGRLAEFRGGSQENYRTVLWQFPVVLGIAAVFGVAGYVHAAFLVDDEAVDWVMPIVLDPSAFVQVGSIHNFGYAGVLVGLIVAGRRVWKKTESPSSGGGMDDQDSVSTVSACPGGNHRKGGRRFD